jgi:hypothetical protein
MASCEECGATETAGRLTRPIYRDPSNDKISFSSLDAYNDYRCEQKSRLNHSWASSTRQFALVKLLLGGG